MKRPKGLKYIKHKENPTSFKKGEKNKNWNGFKKGLIPWNKGLKGGEYLKHFKNLKEHAIKSLTRHTPTNLEIKFSKIIEKNNFPYKFVGDGKFFVGSKNPDFMHNNEKIAIEVYNSFYKNKHYGDINKWRLERFEYFRKLGWFLIFFDEKQVNEEYVRRILT